MHIKLNNISYSHPNKEILFKELNFSIADNKTGLIGDNGSGKTTLLKIIAGKLRPDEGSVSAGGNITVFPQDFSAYNNMTLAEVLSVKEKLYALEKILNGESTQDDYDILNNEWDLHERIKEIFEEAKLQNFNLNRNFSTLSGGEKSRLLFASLLLNNPDFALLDEPTNHLDRESRSILYSMIKNYKRGLLIISHDRKLLNLMEEINELSDKGIKTYGGNYDFYKEQKEIETEASLAAYNSLQLQYTKAVKEKNKTIEKQERRTAKGKKRNILIGMDKAEMDYMKENAMRTFSKLKHSHTQKTESLKNRLQEAKENLDNSNSIIVDVNAVNIHSRKIILEVKELNFRFQNSEEFLWKENINFTISGSERWSIAGVNGSGKSVLLKLILNKFNPSEGESEGEIKLNSDRVVFLDQAVEILDGGLTVFENLKKFSKENPGNEIPEHELRIKLGRFLFRGEDAFKKVSDLSGGEKMRAGLACILAAGSAPELLILDEPSNNLDLKSIKELTAALNQYNGALLVVSHDEDFLDDIEVNKQLLISRDEKHKLMIP